MTNEEAQTIILFLELRFPKPEHRGPVADHELGDVCRATYDLNDGSWIDCFLCQKFLFADELIKEIRERMNAELPVILEDYPTPVRYN